MPKYICEISASSWFYYEEKSTLHLYISTNITEFFACS